MPREPEPSLNEKAFIATALAQDNAIRLDGRGAHDLRPLSIALDGSNTTNGSGSGVYDTDHAYGGRADIQLGQTRVMTQISASIVVPPSDRKFDGQLGITCELSPLASPAIEPNSRPTETESHLLATLDTLFRRSHALATESLCICAGKAVWSLRANVHVLSHDGSLVCASSLSLLCALLSLRLPECEVTHTTNTANSNDNDDAIDIKIYTPDERDPVPLALLHMPLAVEYAIFTNTTTTSNTAFILDPTLAEAQSSASYIIIGANRDAEIVLLDKRGGVDVDASILLFHAVAPAVDVIQGLLQQRVFPAIQRSKTAESGDEGRVLEELAAEHDR